MFQFGSGVLVARNNAVSNPQPILLGTLQEVNVNIDRTMKELYGAYQMPVAIGAGEMKISGTSKFATFNFANLTNLFFGTAPSVGTQPLAIAEQGTVATTSITVTNAATFKEDYGVFYKTSGLQLTRVASAPTVGQYSVNETTGVYTFNATDNAQVMLIYYMYTVASGGQQGDLTNPLQGAQIQFDLTLQNTFQGKTLTLRLNNCVSSKLAIPYKQSEFSIPEMDFMAFADASNTLGHLSVSE